MIAERIKALREQSGLSQSDLSKQLGLSRSAINAWEMGISVPSTQYLVELANLFKVTTDYLLGLQTTETIEISGFSTEEKEILYGLVRYFKKG